MQNSKYYLVNNCLPVIANVADILELKKALILHYDLYVFSLKEITEQEYYKRLNSKQIKKFDFKTW